MSQPVVVVVNDPLSPPPNSFHMFILGLAALNGLSTMLGFATSASLNAGMTKHLVQVYGALLGFSALCCLAHGYWRWDPRDGLLVGRIGYRGLTFATAIFGFATPLLYGFEGILSSCITLGFSFVCWKTSRKISEKIVEAVGARDG